MSARRHFMFGDDEAAAASDDEDGHSSNGLEFGSGDDDDGDDEGGADEAPIETEAEAEAQVGMMVAAPPGNEVLQDLAGPVGESAEEVWARVTTHFRNMESVSPSEMYRYVFTNILGLHDEQLPRNPCELQARLWTRLIYPAQKAAYELCYDPMTGQTDYTREYTEVLYRTNAINMMLYFAHEFTFPGPRIAHNILQVMFDAAPIPVPVLMSAKTKVRMWCLTIARQRQLGHSDGFIVQKKYLNHGTVDTHYWERVATISSYFESQVDPLLHPHIMQIFTDMPDIFQKIEKVLCANHPELPEVLPDRRFASTLDGIYDMWTDHFYPYGPAAREIPIEPGQTEVVSSVFISGTMGEWYDQPLLGFRFDREFEATPEQQTEYRANPDFVRLPTFRDELPTPLFNTLMDTQQWSEDVQFWFMYLYGRLFHPIGKHDKCQVATLMYGIARSGKSVFLEIASKFFPDEKVGKIESHGEKTFGPSNLCGKWIWQCAELEVDTNLDTGFIKQLIEGAKITAAKKYKDPVVLAPEGHGIIATNNDIAVSGMFGGNNQGAIARRFVTFPFFYLPTNIHSDLYGEICETGELIRIFRKCNMIYLIGNELLKKLFRGDIWLALPQSILDQREHMMMYSAEIYEFIMTNPNVMLGPECMVTMSELQHEFDAWQNGETGAVPMMGEGGAGGNGGGSGGGGGGRKKNKTKWTAQLYQAVFQRLRCEVKQVRFNQGSDSMVVDLSIPPEHRDYSRFDFVRNAVGGGSREVFFDHPTEDAPQVSTEVVFGIGISGRDPRRVIPSFVQRVMMPSDEHSITVNQLQRYVEYYRDKYYPNEKQYIWQSGYMIECLRVRGFQFHHGNEQIVYAKIGKF